MKGPSDKYLALAEEMEHLEQRMDTTMLRHGKNEEWWELQERLDRVYTKMDMEEEMMSNAKD